MTHETYHHTQPGYLALVALGAGLGLTFYLMVVTAFNPVAVAVAVVLAGLLVGFSSLTVEVDAEAVTAWFGPGLARRRFPLGQVRGARIVYNPWYFGWGIRWIAGIGWVYNVSGTAAVELWLEGEQRFRVGTDTPSELARALEAHGVPLLPT
ncbi:MAG: hypothetical protein ACYC1C_07555 [Chloroflexota bacterium]